MSLITYGVLAVSLSSFHGVRIFSLVYVSVKVHNSSFDDVAKLKASNAVEDIVLSMPLMSDRGVRTNSNLLVMLTALRVSKPSSSFCWKSTLSVTLNASRRCAVFAFMMTMKEKRCGNFFVSICEPVSY